MFLDLALLLASCTTDTIAHQRHWLAPFIHLQEGRSFRSFADAFLFDDVLCATATAYGPAQRGSVYAWKCVNRPPPPPEYVGNRIRLLWYNNPTCRVFCFFKQVDPICHVTGPQSILPGPQPINAQIMRFPSSPQGRLQCVSSLYLWCKLSIHEKKIASLSSMCLMF